MTKHEVPLADVLFEAWLFQRRNNEALEREIEMMLRTIMGLRDAWLEDNPGAEQARPELFE